MITRYAFDLKAKASELSPAERRFRVADHPTGTRDLTFIPSGWVTRPEVVKRLQGFRTAGDAEARPVAVIRNTASRIHEGLMKYLLQPALVFVCIPSALLH
jgi:hypothetical protein